MFNDCSYIANDNGDITNDNCSYITRAAMMDTCCASSCKSLSGFLEEAKLLPPDDRSLELELLHLSIIIAL